MDGTTSAYAENAATAASSTPTPGNYLRIRGEYRREATVILDVTELPPRARRIPNIRGLAFDIHRNYLRVRGEYLNRPGNWYDHGELPPRARRIQETGRLPRRSIGTTSACAENTVSGSVGVLYTRNYLRVRGEYCLAKKPHGLHTELPPRARRIPWGFSYAMLAHGTTSACAENTRRV